MRRTPVRAPLALAAGGGREGVPSLGDGDEPDARGEREDPLPEVPDEDLTLEGD